MEGEERVHDRISRRYDGILGRLTREVIPLEVRYDSQDDLVAALRERTKDLPHETKLHLAGMITGYTLDQEVRRQTAEERSEGLV